MKPKGIKIRIYVIKNVQKTHTILEHCAEAS